MNFICACYYTNTGVESHCVLPDTAEERAIGRMCSVEEGSNRTYAIQDGNEKLDIPGFRRMVRRLNEK